jgi:hypothetical protein
MTSSSYHSWISDFLVAWLFGTPITAIGPWEICTKCRRMYLKWYSFNSWSDVGL